jgi:hypothetical protein
MTEASIRDRCAKIRLGPLSARELPVLVERLRSAWCGVHPGTCAGDESK